MQRVDNYRFVNFAILLFIAVLSVYILIVAKWILAPLAWALFLSLLILPVVQWFEQRRVPRLLAIIIVLTLVTVILGLILYLLAVQVAGLLGETPIFTDKLTGWIVDFQQFVQTELGVSPEFFSKQLADSTSEMINIALKELQDSLFSVFRTLTVISIVPLYAFFMLFYRDTFFEGFLGIAKSYQKEASYLVGKANRVLQQYLSGMMLVTVILAAMFYLTLILFGINYALFFAVFLAIFNLIPYIGVIIASLVVVLYTIATVDSFFFPAAVLLSLWVIQVIENNFITPYIVGLKVKLNPMVALIAILAGASIWGISGMILFLPALGALKAIFDEIEALKPYGLLLGSSAGLESK